MFISGLLRISSNVKTQKEHAKLLCPIMMHAPRCCTDKCAMWRWIDSEEQESDWVTYSDGQKLKAEGWAHQSNDGCNLHRYVRPYPLGERPGICALAKEQ